MAEKTETKTPAVEETKADKFTRIATLRTNKSLSAIASLGGLAATANYEYTKEQWDKIFSALLNEMNKVKAKVESGGKAVVDGGFSL